jgi:hypothetical protein
MFLREVTGLWHEFGSPACEGISDRGGERLSLKIEIAGHYP